MKRLARKTAARIVAATALVACVPLATAAGQDDPRRELIATLQPAVVNITIVIRERTGPVGGNMVSQPTVAEHTAQSSGFFVRASGIIVTNRHTVAAATEITVGLHDGTRLKACILASAAQSDIALLRVSAGKPMPTVAFGDSDALHPGDPIFVIGNPLGLGNTVTAGIVSALDRNTDDSGFSSFLQTDAPLNHGNSGGPVFAADGSVVGIATALYTPEGETGSVGLGLVIPANDASFVVERLLQHGRLELGWIGAHVQPVSADIAAAVKLPAAVGAIVTEVHDDSPATRAGLRPGDVILRVAEDGGSGPRTLSRAIAGSPVGGVIKLVVWRDGTLLSVPIVVASSPADKAPPKWAASVMCEPPGAPRGDLGLVLGPITEAVRGKLGLDPHAAGVLVNDVAANSVAADRGIAAGSVIENVQQRSVAAPADVRSAIAAARADRRGFVLVLVRDAQGLRWVALPLDGERS